jgi:2-aminoadipate transaminase
MVEGLKKYLPAGCELTPTEGGMFLWVTLPNDLSAVELYRKALDKGVAICPGDPFYEYKRNVSSFRVNYSNSTDEAIEKGIKILGEACEELLNA